MGSTQRFGLPLEARRQIAVGLVVARPLQQAETARVVVGEHADPQLARIDQRPPQRLARGTPDGQAVGVVHLAAGIVDAHPVVGAEEVHAGKRRDPDLLHVGTKEQARIDRHQSSIARRHVETVGAGDAGAVQQRADLQWIAWIVRPEDPKIGEYREFFGLAEPGLQRQPARGDAEAGVAGDGPEIAGAQKSQQLLRCAAVLEHVVDAKASKPGILGQWVGNLDGAEVEHRLIVKYLPGVALLHHEHPHRVTVVGTQMDTAAPRRRWCPGGWPDRPDSGCPDTGPARGQTATAGPRHVVDRPFAPDSLA